MKKFEITEEQIKTLENDGINYIKEWFPEVFETKLEIGKWYKCHHNKALFFITKVDPSKGDKGDCKAYGFNMDGVWTNEKWDVSHYKNENRWMIEATEEQVKSALIKEAERRGFKSGAKFKSCISENGELRTAEEFRGDLFHFYFNDNELTISTSINEWIKFNSNPHIFKDGVWAEVIKLKYYTKEQAEKRLTELENDGYEYEIID